MNPIARRVAAGLASAGARKILLACSGGPDSIALLDVLASLRADFAVACVDHQLRPSSGAEAESVVAEAARRGLDGVILRVTVERPCMALARKARYDALTVEAKARGCDALVAAHSATDQVETLLDRLLRGAGTRGLSAMARVREIAPGLRLVRPLLDVTRDELEAYVREKNLAVVRDPTNADRRYRRARLRHDVLPLLRRERPDLDRAVAQLCDRLRADADALDAEALRAHAALAQPDGLDCRALVDLPDAIAARVVARAAGVPLEAVHVGALRKLCADPRGTRWLDLPGGVRAERRYDRLRFGAPTGDPGDLEIVVDGPGRYDFFSAIVEVPPGIDEGGKLILRNLRPGELRWLKRRMIDDKIPQPERRRLPVLFRRTSDGEELLWAGGVRGRFPVACALTREIRVQ